METYEQNMLKDSKDTNNIPLELYLYQQYDAMHDIEESNKRKYVQFLNRLKQFESITGLKEAQELMKKILPVSSKITRFAIGNAKCVILNYPNLFRISVNSPTEFISYNFE